MNVTPAMNNYNSSNDPNVYQGPSQVSESGVATKDLVTITINPQPTAQPAAQPAASSSQGSSDIMGALGNFFKALGNLIKGNNEQATQSQPSKASDTMQMVVDLLKSILALLGMGQKDGAKPAAPAPMPSTAKPTQGGGEAGGAQGGAPAQGAGGAAPAKGDIGTFETDGDVGFTQQSLDQGIASKESNIGKREALLTGFDKYETKAFGGEGDGIIGKQDLEAMAKDTSLDPAARQAAQEVLDNPNGELAKSMNIHPEGKMFEGKQDIGISRESIISANTADQNSITQMQTAKGAFDKADTAFAGGGTGDGHIGQRDLEKAAADKDHVLHDFAKDALAGKHTDANIHTNGMLDAKKAA